VAEFLLIKGAKVNAIDELGLTPLDYAIRWKVPKIVNLLRKHGGKTKKEPEAEGK
jgi:ankyrin repeat protein